MQNRRRLGGGRIDSKILNALRLLHLERHFARLQRRFACVHHDDVSQVRQLFANLANFGEMFLLGDDCRRVGVLQAYEERLISKSGKQRLSYRAHLQDAQKPDVQLGHPVHEQTHPFAGQDTESVEEVGYSVGQNAQVIKSEPLLVALVVFPMQCQLVSQAQVAKAVAAHPANIDRGALTMAQLTLGHTPVEVRRKLLIGRRVTHRYIRSWRPWVLLSVEVDPQVPG